MGWVGWDNNVHAPARTHTGTATPSSFLLSCKHRHCTFIIVSFGVRWVGSDTELVFTQSQLVRRGTFLYPDRMQVMMMSMMTMMTMMIMMMLMMMMMMMMILESQGR